MMNESVKGALAGAAFGGVIWACTGMWQFFAVAMVGALCTWMFTPPTRVQPRPRVRGKIRVGLKPAAEAELRARYGRLPSEMACYDYGGCKWTGDGCAGKPLVLGPGKGCAHTQAPRVLPPADAYGPSTPKIRERYDSDDYPY